MTRTKTRPFDDEEIVIAWQGVSVGDHTVPVGTRLRASHPAVKTIGRAAFIEEAVPPAEWPSARTEAIALLEGTATAAATPEVPSRIDPATPLRELRICTQGVVSSAAGPCAEHRIVTATDPIVAIAPQCFRPLAEVLGP